MSDDADCHICDCDLGPGPVSPAEAPSQPETPETTQSGPRERLAAFLEGWSDSPGKTDVIYGVVRLDGAQHDLLASDLRWLLDETEPEPDSTSMWHEGKPCVLDERGLCTTPKDED